MVSTDRKLISRAEAARRLGVSQATVINYAELGFIKETGAGGRYLVDGESVDSLLSTEHELDQMRKRYIGSDSGRSLERLEKEISDKEKKLSEKRQMLENKEMELDYALEQFRSVVPQSIMKKKFTVEFLKQLIALATGRQMKPKHQLILESYVRGEAFTDIASSVSMTIAGVREVISSMINSLETLLTYPELEQRISKLEMSNSMLEAENVRLQDSIVKLSEGETVSQEMLVRKSEKSINSMHIEDPQLGLPIRAVNSLCSNRIRTIGDLRKYTYREMINFRGMGKKSLDDVSKCLEKFGVRISCAPE
jgi:hypothetical protein